jgi:hypothetical protein
VGSDSSISGHLIPGEKPRSALAIAPSADEAPSAKPPGSLLVGKVKLGGDSAKKHKIKVRH